MTETTTLASKLIPYERIAEAAEVIPAIFSGTPQFVSDSMSRQLRMRCLCKIESVNPIRSFKGRGTAYLMHCRQDVDRPFVAASAGNFGQGLAYAAREHGKKAIVFAPTNANPLKIQRMKELGAEVRLAGNDFDFAKSAAREYASSNSMQFIEDGLDVEIAVGAGTIALELCKFQEVIDCVLAPVGNGSLINGIGSWMKARNPSCKVIGVCASGAPVMAHSWRSRRVQESGAVNTIADGIAVRVPVREALDVMAQSVDDVVLVSDEQILDAMKLCYRALGIIVEPAGAAAVAGAMEIKDRLAGQLVALPICGSNLTQEQIRKWLT